MTYFVAYAGIDTSDLFDPSTYFNSVVQDIGTQNEFRSHIATESLDLAGLGMNDLDTAIVQSISVYVGSGISGPSSEQSLSWQATGLSTAYTALFNTTFSPRDFGAALLAGSDTLRGSNASDTLYAYSGNDVVLGGGGADVIDGGRGKDTLTGGAGNDEFRFDAPVKAANADHVIDFRSGHDQLSLAYNIYNSLVGGVNADNFVVGTHPNDANDYLIYNSSTGVLSYDADGSNSGHAMIAIATLDHHPTLVVSDIFVVV